MRKFHRTTRLSIGFFILLVETMCTSSLQMRYMKPPCSHVEIFNS